MPNLLKVLFGSRNDKYEGIPVRQYEGGDNVDDLWYRAVEDLATLSEVLGLVTDLNEFKASNDKWKTLTVIKNLLQNKAGNKREKVLEDLNTLSFKVHKMNTAKLNAKPTSKRIKENEAIVAYWQLLKNPKMTRLSYDKMVAAENTARDSLGMTKESPTKVVTTISEKGDIRNEVMRTSVLFRDGEDEIDHRTFTRRINTHLRKNVTLNVVNELWNERFPDQGPRDKLRRNQVIDDGIAGSSTFRTDGEPPRNLSDELQAEAEEQVRRLELVSQIEGIIGDAERLEHIPHHRDRRLNEMKDIETSVRNGKLKSEGLDQVRSIFTELKAADAKAEEEEARELTEAATAAAAAAAAAADVLKVAKQNAVLSIYGTITETQQLEFLSSNDSETYIRVMRQNLTTLESADNMTQDGIEEIVGDVQQTFNDAYGKNEEEEARAKVMEDERKAILDQEMNALFDEAKIVKDDLQLEGVVRRMTEPYELSDPSTDPFKGRIYEFAFRYLVAKTKDELAKNPISEPETLGDLTALYESSLDVDAIKEKRLGEYERVLEMRDEYREAIVLTERAFDLLDERMPAKYEIGRIKQIFPDGTMPPTDAFRLTDQAVRIHTYRTPDANIAKDFGSLSLETPQQRFHAAGVVVLKKTGIQNEKRMKLFRQILTAQTEKDMERVHQQLFIK